MTTSAATVNVSPVEVPPARMRLLTSPLGRAFAPATVLLRYASRTGATITLPVQAPRGSGRVLRAGRRRCADRRRGGTGYAHLVLPLGTFTAEHAGPDRTPRLPVDQVIEVRH